MNKPFGKMKLKCKQRPYYFNIYLWDTHKEFQYKTHYRENTLGCCKFTPILEDLHEDKRHPWKPKLGDIHLIKDKWSLEIVSHELCHALLLRLDILKPRFNEAIPTDNAELYESICYEFGIWVETVYGWLWQINPSKKWRKK